MNEDYDRETGYTMMLDKEVGIPELEELYFDKYNYKNGSFDEMTPETKKVYEKDVKEFYKVFTNLLF